MKKLILSLCLASAAMLGTTQAFAGGSCCGGGYATKKADSVETAASAGNFQTLVAAIDAAGLTETLQGDGPYTIFMPTDQAFAKLPQGTMESLMKPENKDQLAAILTYHVVPGKVMTKDVKPGELATVNGAPLVIGYKDGHLMVDNAEVIITDVVTSNGVIHVIDTVVLPNTKTAALVD